MTAARLVIAIDGPAAAGKSTTARGVARRLGLMYVDTGAMYRALALKALRRGIAVDDTAAIERLLASTAIDLTPAGDDGVRVWLDGEDVTGGIRDEHVGGMASAIAVIGAVRRFLVEQQRQVAAGGGVVMEGRDIGTVVLPGADLKVHLVASVEVRSERRRQELHARHVDVSLAEVQRGIEERDRRDRERADSPLRPAADAVIIDTSALTIDGQVERVLEEVARLGARRAAGGGGGGDTGIGAGAGDGDSERAGAGDGDSERGGAGDGDSERAGAAAAPGELPDIGMSRWYRSARWLARMLARIVLGWRVEGVENIPARGGFILVANHRSYLDPPLVGAASRRRLCYMAKKQLFEMPLFGRLITSLGAVPIRREGLDREALRLTSAFLAAGGGVLVFPGGTRARPGVAVRAHPGASFLAARCQVPLVPARIDGTAAIGAVVRRRRPLSIRFGAAIAPPPPGDGAEHREVLRRHAAHVMDVIDALAGGEGRQVDETGPSDRRSSPAETSKQGGRFIHVHG